MNAQTVGIVLVRLFSIYLVITALQSLSYTLPALFNFGAGSVSAIAILGSVTLWLGISTIAIPALCAWWLWRNAERVLPEGATGDLVNSNASDMMLVGVSLLGLYLLTWGVINFVRIEAGMAMTERFPKDSALLQRIPYIAQIIIAIPMLLSRHRLTELLVKAKYAGTNAGQGAD
ncbi:MAG: hypothetical protein QNJ05_09280 [Woeseiaceae bacterium]|nr:hypothetical protein [Woeseiaceae bacterium]